MLGRIVIGACLLAAAAANAETVFTIHGLARSCADIATLERALDSPGDSYIANWSAADFDQAQNWVESCKERYAGQKRALLQLLAVAKSGEDQAAREQQHQNSVAQSHASDADVRRAQQAAVAAQQAAEDRAAEAAERDRRRKDDAALAIANAASTKCKASKLYQLYTLENRIWRDIHAKRAAQKVLDNDEKVAAVSGTTNLAARYQAGQAIVAADEDIEKVWPAYKAAGGEADSLPFVDSRQNPCS